jgi:hypothetical protein
MSLFSNTVPIHICDKYVTFDVETIPTRIEFRSHSSRINLNVPAIGQCIGSMGLELYRASEYSFLFMKTVPACICVFYNAYTHTAYAPKFDDYPCAKLVHLRTNYLLDMKVLNVDNDNIVSYKCGDEILCPTEYVTSMIGESMDIDLRVSSNLSTLTIIAYLSQISVDLTFYTANGREIYICVDFDTIVQPLKRLRYDREIPTIATIGQSSIVTYICSNIPILAKIYDGTSTCDHEITYALKRENSRWNYLEVTVYSNVVHETPIIMVTSDDDNSIETALMIPDVPMLYGATTPSHAITDVDTCAIDDIDTRVIVDVVVDDNTLVVRDIRKLLKTSYLPTSVEIFDNSTVIKYYDHGALTIVPLPWTSHESKLKCTFVGDLIVNLILNIIPKAFEPSRLMFQYSNDSATTCLIPLSLLFPGGYLKVAVDTKTIVVKTHLNVNGIKIRTNNENDKFLVLQLCKNQDTCKHVTFKHTASAQTIDSTLTFVPMISPQDTNITTATIRIGIGHNVVPFEEVIAFFALEMANDYTMLPDITFRVDGVADIMARGTIMIIDVHHMNATPLPKLKIRFAGSVKIVTFICSALPGDNNIYMFGGLPVPVILSDNCYNPNALKLVSNYTIGDQTGPSATFTNDHVTIRAGAIMSIFRPENTNTYGILSSGEIQVSYIDDFKIHRGNNDVTIMAGPMPLFPTCIKYISVSDHGSEPVIAGSVWDSTSAFKIGAVIFRNRIYVPGDTMYFEGGIIVVNSDGQFVFSRNMNVTVMPTISDIFCFDTTSLESVMITENHNAASRKIYQLCDLPKRRPPAVLSLQVNLIRTGPFFANLKSTSTSTFSLDLPTDTSVLGYRIFNGNHSFIDPNTAIYIGNDQFSCNTTGHCKFVSDSGNSQIVHIKLLNNGKVHTRFLYISTFPDNATHTGTFILEDGVSIVGVRMEGIYNENESLSCTFGSSTEKGTVQIFATDDVDRYTYVITMRQMQASNLQLALRIDENADMHIRTFKIPKCGFYDMRTHIANNSNHSTIYALHDPDSIPIKIHTAYNAVSDELTYNAGNGAMVENEPVLTSHRSSPDFQKELQKLSLSRRSSHSSLRNALVTSPLVTLDADATCSFDERAAKNRTPSPLIQDSVQVSVRIATPPREMFTNSIPDIPEPDFTAEDMSSFHKTTMRSNFGLCDTTFNMNDDPPMYDTDHENEVDSTTVDTHMLASNACATIDDSIQVMHDDAFFQPPAANHVDIRDNIRDISDNGDHAIDCSDTRVESSVTNDMHGMEEMAQHDDLYECVPVQSEVNVTHLEHENVTSNNYKILDPLDMCCVECISILGMIGITVPLHTVMKDTFIQIWNNVKFTLKSESAETVDLDILGDQNHFGCKTAIRITQNPAQLNPDTPIEICELILESFRESVWYSCKIRVEIYGVTKSPKPVTYGKSSLIKFITHPSIVAKTSEIILDDPLHEIELSHISAPQILFKMKFNIAPSTENIPSQEITIDMSSLQLWVLKHAVLTVAMNVIRKSMINSIAACHVTNNTARTYTRQKRISQQPTTSANVQSVDVQDEPAITIAPHTTIPTVSSVPATHNFPESTTENCIETAVSFPSHLRRKHGSEVREVSDTRSHVPERPSLAITDLNSSYVQPVSHVDESEVKPDHPTDKSADDRLPPESTTVNTANLKRLEPKELSSMATSRNMQSSAPRSFKSLSADMIPPRAAIPLTVGELTRSTSVQLTAPVHRLDARAEFANVAPLIVRKSAPKYDRSTVMVARAKAARDIYVKNIYTSIRVQQVSHVDCHCNESLQILAIPGGIVFRTPGLYVINGIFHKATNHQKFTVPPQVIGTIVKYKQRLKISSNQCTSARIFAIGESEPVEVSINVDDTNASSYVDISAYSPGISVAICNNSTIILLHYIV